MTTIERPRHTAVVHRQHNYLLWVTQALTGFSGALILSVTNLYVLAWVAAGASVTSLIMTAVFLSRIRRHQS